MTGGKTATPATGSVNGRRGIDDEDFGRPSIDLHTEETPETQFEKEYPRASGARHSFEDDEIPFGCDEPRPRLAPISWKAALRSSTAMQFVSGVLYDGSLIVVYGATNAGKTFWAINLSAHVTLGRNWHGRSVAQGGVVYLATEGGGGITGRLRACWQHCRPKSDEPPLFVIPDAIDLCRSDADTDLLIEQIVPLGPVLIVVDTLSRALAGGNENASDDMGALVRNLDRIRRETGAAVMVIHHSGKNEAAGARGHSLLRAAADTEIEITKEGDVVAATVTKQRERAAGDVFRAELKTVDIGTEADGTPATSCVLVPHRTDAGKALTPKAARALEALEDLIRDAGTTIPPEAAKAARGVTSGATLKGWCHILECDGQINPKGNPRQEFKRIRVTLENAGLIGVSGDFVWCVT